MAASAASQSDVFASAVRRCVGGAPPAASAASQSDVLAGSGRRQQAAESSSKFGVEDGVDDRVDEAVDVTEPDEEREERRVHVADWTAVHVVTYADSVDDV